MSLHLAKSLDQQKSLLSAANTQSVPKQAKFTRGKFRNVQRKLLASGNSMRKEALAHRALKNTSLGIITPKACDMIIEENLAAMKANQPSEAVLELIAKLNEKS